MPPNKFLLPPTDGWTGALDPAQRDALARGFDALAHGGDPAAALAAADGVLASTPDFPPALVLAAQSEFVREAPDQARSLLASWIDQQPSYRAARLLWARLLELDGEVVPAYAEYRTLAADLPVAAERERALREPAVTAAQAALAEALAAARIEEARALADRIAEWDSPDATAALEARLAVARAAGDAPTELEALRALHQRGDVAGTLAAGTSGGDLERARQRLGPGDGAVGIEAVHHRVDAHESAVDHADDLLLPAVVEHVARDLRTAALGLAHSGHHPIEDRRVVAPAELRPRRQLLHRLGQEPQPEAQLRRRELAAQGGVVRRVGDQPFEQM